MNRRVSKNLSRLENLPYYGSFAKSICVGRIVFVLSSYPICRYFSIDKEGRKSAKDCILYKQALTKAEG